MRILTSQESKSISKESGGCIKSATELSYLDMLAGLRDDIASDMCMPKEIRSCALEEVSKLADMLSAYSA